MSTVAKKVLMGGGAVAEPLEIEQSLIFNDDSSAHLTRTPSSASNRKTWTWSSWVKRANLASSGLMGFMGACDGTDSNATWIGFSNDSLANIAADGDVSLVTTAVFRDPSAWYHIVFVYDSTQGTASNRQKIYVNGVQETSFSTANYPSQNLDSFVNNNVQHSIGARTRPSGTTVSFFDGYLAETNFIDGTQLTPSSFGETNDDTGQWIPKKYSGSYGTNGFYLKFVSGALGTDSSGQGNNYTASNLANHDVVIDTPNNNFATLLSFAGFGTYNSATPTTTAITTSEGNLVGTGASGINGSGSMAVSSGKWYWEVMVIGSSGYGHAGIYGYGSGRISDSLRVDNGNKYRFMLNADDGEWQYATNGGSFSSAVAITGDSGNAVNGPWAASLTCFGTGSKLHFNFGQNGTFNGAATASGNADSGGIGDFFYAPPSGYKALCTANLPDPAIPLPSAQFNTVLYAGNQTAKTIDVGMQPDFTWIKTRNAAGYHYLADAVRGFNTATNGSAKVLASNDAAAEAASETTQLLSFVSNGFTLGDNSDNTYFVNRNSHTYVAWNWKANGSGSTDTSGDIDATVSANQTAGFSIVNYVPNGTASATVPHGLGVAPEMVFYKRYNSSSQWFCWTTVIDGSDDYLVLDSTDAAAAVSQAGGTSFTSSFIRATNYGASGSPEVVAYCFASKPSFSKVGSYTGNGSADGPMVNTGFKPAWLMIKNTSNAQDWILFDTKRNPFNEVKQFLYPNLSADEGAGSNVIDLVSNGFKLRNAGTRNRNYNGDVYLYMAFAESPFKTANAR